MNHERFERLILEGPQVEGDTADLLRHLAGCRSCRELQARWSAVEARLNASPQEQPQPAFAARWASRHAAAETGRRRSQAWRLFGAVSLGAALLAFGLTWGLAADPGFLANVFAGALKQGIEVWLWARLAGEFTRVFASSLPAPLAAAAALGYVLLVAGAGLAAAFGTFGIIRFSFQGARR
jgi:hypothetical protein